MIELEAIYQIVTKSRAITLALGDKNNLMNDACSLTKEQHTNMRTRLANAFYDDKIISRDAFERIDDLIRTDVDYFNASVTAFKLAATLAFVHLTLETSE